MGVLVDAQAARARKALMALRELMPPLFLLPPPLFTRRTAHHPRAPLHTILVRPGRRAGPHVLVVIMMRRGQLRRRRARMRVVEPEVETREHRCRLGLSRTQRRACAQGLVVSRELRQRRRRRRQRARERRKVVQDRRRVRVWRQQAGRLRPAGRAATRTSDRRVRWQRCGCHIGIVLVLRGVGVQGGAGAPARAGVRRRAAMRGLGCRRRWRQWRGAAGAAGGARAVARRCERGGRAGWQSALRTLASVRATRKGGREAVRTGEDLADTGE
jgi:hypothetical protein